MSIENREDYISYRFQRAEESLEEALILAKNGKWNAVIALLLKHDIETKSHDGARIQFGLHFIKSGEIDRKFGKLFTKLYDYRQKGDNGDLYDYKRGIVEPLIEETEHFVEEIRLKMY